MQTQPGPVPIGELNPTVRSVSIALFTQAAFGLLGLFLDIKVLSSQGENQALHGALLLIFDIILAIAAVGAALIVRQGTPQARWIGVGVGGLGVLLGVIVLLVQSDQIAMFVFPQQLAAVVVVIFLLEPSGRRAFTQPMPPGGLMSAFSALGGSGQQAGGFGQYPQQGPGYPQQGGYPQQAPGYTPPQPQAAPQPQGAQGGAYYPGSPQPTEVIPTYPGQQSSPPPPASGGWQPPQDSQG